MKRNNSYRIKKGKGYYYPTSVSLHPATLRELDRVRGLIPRSVYLRHLLEERLGFPESSVTAEFPATKVGKGK